MSLHEPSRRGLSKLVFDMSDRELGWETELGDAIDGMGDAISSMGAPIGGMGDRIGGMGDAIGDMGDAIGDMGDPIGDMGDAIGDMGDRIGGLGDRIGGLGAPIGGLGDAIGGLGDQIGGMGVSAPRALSGRLRHMRDSGGETPPAEALLEPVGRGERVVQQGDCMSSIALATGHYWQRLWDHPDNRALRDAREDPYVLLPGDRVTVPPLREKTLDCETGRRHTFRRLGVPERLRIRLVDRGEPRAGEPFLLVVDGAETEGTTSADGSIELWISPQAQRATLYLHDGEHEIGLGRLDPVGSRAGAAARLANLGLLLAGMEEDDAAYRAAISVFQRRRGLEATAQLDEPTRRALETAYREWSESAQ